MYTPRDPCARVNVCLPSEHFERHVGLNVRRLHSTRRSLPLHMAELAMPQQRQSRLDILSLDNQSPSR
jgi:hypothetical protein